MQLLVGTGLVIIVGIMMFTNYVINKDEEEPPSFAVKLWLVPLLSLLIILPLGFFALLYWGLIKLTGFFNPGDIAILNDMSLFGASLLLIAAFLLSEVLIEPFCAVLYYFVVKRKPTWPEKNIFSLLLDTVVIYLVMDLVPSVDIKSWMTAFSISVIAHLIGWLIEGVEFLVKRYRSKKHNGGTGEGS